MWNINFTLFISYFKWFINKCLQSEITVYKLLRFPLKYMLLLLRYKLTYNPFSRCWVAITCLLTLKSYFLWTTQSVNASPDLRQNLQQRRRRPMHLLLLYQVIIIHKEINRIRSKFCIIVCLLRGYFTHTNLPFANVNPYGRIFLR